MPLLNSLVLYVGSYGVSHQKPSPSSSFPEHACMDIFDALLSSLDPEGRYYALNAIANQLRYPNSHTHYFSMIAPLPLPAGQGRLRSCEQITRVLLERLIVHRPHPWGLLITFIELIKNPRYKFWEQAFTRCAPEIEKLFESVARSCMPQGQGGRNGEGGEGGSQPGGEEGN